MKKLLFISAAIMALISCGSNSATKPADDDATPKKVNLADSLLGDWIMVQDGTSGEITDTTGVTLQKDGKAQSINMPTYQYKSWSLKNDTIILNAVSTAEGLPTDTTISDTGIVDVKANTITLFAGDITYKRK